MLRSFFGVYNRRNSTCSVSINGIGFFLILVHLRLVRAAPGNEGFAHFLRRDSSKAFQMASERRSLYPCSTRLAAMWIMSSPPGTSLAEFEGALHSSLFSDHEVCVALARRAM